MYDNTGNNVPKTADILNFVGILTNEPQVTFITGTRAVLLTVSKVPHRFR